MWHLGAVAALVSFSGLFFEGSPFVELKIVYCIFLTAPHQRDVNGVSGI